MRHAEMSALLGLRKNLRWCVLTHIKGSHRGEVERVVEVHVDAEVGVGGVLDRHVHIRNVSQASPVRVLHQRLHGCHAVLQPH